MSKVSLKSKYSLSGFFSKGFWAVLDQGFFATSNFTVNIFLARWLSMDEYSAFTTVFSVFLLIGTIHTAIITEPLLIYVAGKYKHRKHEYASSIFTGHIYFSVFISIVSFIIYLILYNTNHTLYAKTTLGMLISQPFILLTWLVRRMCYSMFMTRIAAIAGFANLVLTALICYIFYINNLLTSFTAYLLIGSINFTVSLWIIYSLYPSQKILSLSFTDKVFITTHLNYSRWSLPSSILTWVPANIYYVVFPFMGKIELVALLRAHTNLLTPILQFNTAIASQLIPTFSNNNCRKSQDKLINKFIIFLVVIALVYWLCVYIFREQLLFILYGSSFIVQSDNLLILGFLPILTGVLAVIGSAIRANDKPDQVFWSYLYSSIISLTVGVTLIYFYNLKGASLGIIISYIVATITLFYFANKNKKEPTLQSDNQSNTR